MTSFKGLLIALENHEYPVSDAQTDSVTVSIPTENVQISVMSDFFTISHSDGCVDFPLSEKGIGQITNWLRAKWYPILNAQPYAVTKVALAKRLQIKESVINNALMAMSGNWVIFGSDGLTRHAPMMMARPLTEDELINA